MKYDVIIFDADETLFDFKKSEKHAFESTMIENGFEYSEKEHFLVYKEINTAIWKELEEGKISQKELKVERFKRFLEKINSNLLAEDFAKVYMKNLSFASFVYEDSEELLLDLHNDKTLAIITNGLSDVQNNRIRKSVIAKYFKDIVVSEEVNVSKPDPKIFEIAFKNLNIKDKSKVLMVGDSLTSDIQGGINFGIDTCYYNPLEIENKTSIKPTYEINKLAKLKDIL